MSLSIRRQIEALHPWFYPVHIGGYRVTPGIGHNYGSRRLANRYACRRRLLVDGVAAHFCFKNRSVFEVACNCAHWSRHYVALGANRVFGIEGRTQFSRQGQLYWGVGGFLPKGRVCLLQGDINEGGVWAQADAQGPFDVCLCAGILYHVRDYRRLLRRCWQHTKQLLVIDTRVDSDKEQLVLEPGDLVFNALGPDRHKVTPTLDGLMFTLGDLGAKVIPLEVPFATMPGVADVDDYNAGRRVTLLAFR